MKLLKHVIAIIALGSSTALAIPQLQLDIDGGTYVGGSEESTMTYTDTFDLYALLLPGGVSTLSGSYRISAALYPKVAQTMPGPDLGSFTFAGETYLVTKDMSWGTPPEELLALTSYIGAELPSHGVYDTYFMEFDVVFDADQQLGAYNVEDNPGDPSDYSGLGMYYQSFKVDVSNLDDGYGLHFDLYQVDAVAHFVKSANGKKSLTLTSYSTDVINKAPFSHDAGTGLNRVPDQAMTVGMLGGAVLALAGLRRRFIRR